MRTLREIQQQFPAAAETGLTADERRRAAGSASAPTA